MISNEEIFRTALEKISERDGQDAKLLASFALATASLSASKDAPEESLHGWLVDRCIELNDQLQVALVNSVSDCSVEDEIRSAMQMLLRIAAAV